MVQQSRPHRVIIPNEAIDHRVPIPAMPLDATQRKRLCLIVKSFLACLFIAALVFVPAIFGLRHLTEFPKNLKVDVINISIPDFYVKDNKTIEAEMEADLVVRNPNSMISLSFSQIEGILINEINFMDISPASPPSFNVKAGEEFTIHTKFNLPVDITKNERASPGELWVPRVIEQRERSKGLVRLDWSMMAMVTIKEPMFEAKWIFGVNCLVGIDFRGQAAGHGKLFDSNERPCLISYEKRT